MALDINQQEGLPLNYNKYKSLDLLYLDHIRADRADFSAVPR
jgi:hypothetical protein